VVVKARGIGDITETDRRSVREEEERQTPSDCRCERDPTALPSVVDPLKFFRALRDSGGADFDGLERQNEKRYQKSQGCCSCLHRRGEDDRM
jgi:hypothetical protein